VEYERQRAASCVHAGIGLGQRPASRGVPTQPMTTSAPITTAGSGAIESVANVLKAAWMAITANNEPVRS